MDIEDGSDSEDPYKNLNRTISKSLTAANEILDRVLTLRARCAELQLEINTLYEPKFLEELTSLTEETEDDSRIRSYLNMVQDLPDIPAQTSSTKHLGNAMDTFSQSKK